MGPFSSFCNLTSTSQTQWLANTVPVHVYTHHAISTIMYPHISPGPHRWTAVLDPKNSKRNSLTENRGKKTQILNHNASLSACSGCGLLAQIEGYFCADNLERWISQYMYTRYRTPQRYRIQSHLEKQYFNRFSL